MKRSKVKRRAFEPPVPGRNRRAARALWEALSPRQRVQMRRTQAFTVRGSAGGCYRIKWVRREESWDKWWGCRRISIQRVGKRRWFQERYAVREPLADHALAFKLMLETRERSFDFPGCPSLSAYYGETVW